MVVSGELGTLYAVRLAGHDPAPPHESYIPQSGGLFRDFSIHDFDILRWMTGREVEEVYADGGVRGFPVFAKYGDIDTAVVTLRLADGPFTVMTVARHDPLGYDIRAELFGSKDSIAVGLGSRTPIRSVETRGPAAGRSGVARLPRSFRAGLSRRNLRIHPGRTRGSPEPVRSPGWRGGLAYRRGGDSVTPRAPSGATRGDPQLTDRPHRPA